MLARPCESYCIAVEVSKFTSSSTISHLESTYPFTFYAGHGLPDEYLYLIDNDDVRSLDQDQLGGYLFAMSCDTGWFDDPDGYRQGDFEDCITEELTENVGIGFVGCSAASRLVLTSFDLSRTADANGLMESALESLDKMENGELPEVACLPHVYSVWDYVTDFYPFTIA